MTKRLRLPYDIARCYGAQEKDGALREGCKNCLRRTVPGRKQWQLYIEPLRTGNCHNRIDPEDWK